MTTWSTAVQTVTWTSSDDPSVVWQVVLGGTVGGGSAATELGDLTDVDLNPAPDVNDVLAWDGSFWTPATLEDNDELLVAFEALLDTVLGPEE